MRHVWGNGHGSFTTHGNYVSGAERGTIWLTDDRCDGSAVTVHRGAVQVRDIPRHLTILVRDGHHYLARPPRRVRAVRATSPRRP